jgi:uncharacterized protein (TIGR02246 family)
MDLEAQFAIRRLKHEYCHTVDAGEYDEWVSLFTEDGTFDREGADPIEGRDALREMMLEEFDDAFEHTAHVVTNPVIDVDGDVATGRWYVTLVYESAGGTVGRNQGVYEDVYRRVSGEWLIDESVVWFDIT